MDKKLQPVLFQIEPEYLKCGGKSIYITYKSSEYISNIYLDECLFCRCARYRYSWHSRIKDQPSV